MSMHYASPMGKLRIAIIICCLVLILGIFGYAYINDKSSTVLEKDEILANVEKMNDKDYGYSYISSYVKKYGIENVNTYKINSAEDKLEKAFYKDVPDEKEIAKNACLLFIKDYYDTIDLGDKTQVTDAILKCIFKSIGDPYAYYRSREEYLEFLNSLQGGEEFVGIGVSMDPETLEIFTVYEESGAAEVGIKSGDIIYGVDGKTVDDTPLDELLELIKGEPDTTVKITVKRGDKLIEFTVTRKTLTEKSVYHRMEDDMVGYIQITQFLMDTPAQFKTAVDYCIANGAIALVIDLRYNPGGLVNSVADVVDYLAPDSATRRIISYTELGIEYVYYTNDGHSVDLPIAVICNEYTASAGELFTAAMRDYGDEGVLDTVIVGTNTYGKGVAQNSFDLYDLSGITFTISYFNPPCNINFDGIGVAPDFEVEETDDKDAPFETAKEKVLEFTIINDSTTVYVGAAA